MAFVANQEDEEEKRRKERGERGEEGGQQFQLSEGVGMQPGEAEGPTLPKTKRAKDTGFVNLQDYLSLNEGEGQRMADVVGQGALADRGSDIQERVDEDYGHWKESEGLGDYLTGKAGEEEFTYESPEFDNDWENLDSTKYKELTEQAVDLDFEDFDSLLKDSKEIGIEASGQGHREQLAREQFQDQNYSGGMSALDALLMGGGRSDLAQQSVDQQEGLIETGKGYGTEARRLIEGEGGLEETSRVAEDKFKEDYGTEVDRQQSVIDSLISDVETSAGPTSQAVSVGDGGSYTLGYGNMQADPSQIRTAPDGSKYVVVSEDYSESSNARKAKEGQGKLRALAGLSGLDIADLPNFEEIYKTKRDRSDVLAGDRYLSDHPEVIEPVEVVSETPTTIDLDPEQADQTPSLVAGGGLVNPDGSPVKKRGTDAIIGDATKKAGSDTSEEYKRFKKKMGW